jgi:hypothetical protein
MPGADEEVLDEDDDPVTYLITALREDSKLVAKLTTFIAAHPTNTTSIKMQKTHPALINAVAALWRSAAEAEAAATTFDVEKVFELIAHSVWPALDHQHVTLAAKLYDALGVDSASDSPDSMAPLATLSPQLHQLATVWRTTSELERFLLLRCRYTMVLLAEAVDMKRDSGDHDDHMLPKQTRDWIQKGLAFVTKCTQEVAAVDVTSAGQTQTNTCVPLMLYVL